MCTVLLPKGDSPIAVNKYIISFNNCTFCTTLNLCVLYLSENKQRQVPLTVETDWFFNRDEKCLQRGTDWVFK